MSANLPEVTTADSCGAKAVFWPDVEACEAECVKPRGHEPFDVHEDEILGEWHEDDVDTYNSPPHWITCPSCGGSGRLDDGDVGEPCFRCREDGVTDARDA